MNIKPISLWSLGGLLGLSSLSALGDTAVVFNEIMYHPQTNEPAMEWVELYNQMAVNVDMSGWAITGDIDYQFADGTILPGRSYLVVAINPAALTAAAGATNVVGPFTNRLSNAGGSVRLRDNNWRLLNEVNFGTDGNWPVAPDGSGFSLAKRERDTASGPAENWMVSEQRGGTPGRDNFPLLGKLLRETKLMDLEEAWRYDDSGATPAGAWTDRSYNDSAWTSGRALLYHGSQRLGEIQPIPTIYNTGVSDTGAVLPAGVADPHYTMVVSAHGGAPLPATVVLNHPSWSANDNVSSWIGPITPGSQNVEVGSYNFQTRFSLAGYDLASVQVQIQVSVDNTLQSVLLNGVSIGMTYAGFTSFSTTRTITTGLVAGENVLEFRTTNDGTAVNPAGFRALVSGTGFATITNTPLATGRNTYYFRKSFVFDGDPEKTRLKIRPYVDDGAVFYLNGVEIYRHNMPSGTISFSTPALSNIDQASFSGPFTVPAEGLVNGTNVLAVEVHQAVGGSDDLAFGMELYAEPFIPDPITLAFNESASLTNAVYWLELFNHGTNTQALDGCLIQLDGSTNLAYQFPGGIQLAPGTYLALDETDLGFRPMDEDRLLLYAPNFAHVYDAMVVKRTLRGRHPAGTGEWLYPDQPTPGQANSFAFHDEIVINEIMYHHAILRGLSNAPPQESPEAWIELFNRGTNTVDFTGWEIDGGIRYLFPAGTTLAPGEFLVVAKDAASLRLQNPGIAIIGDFSGQLSHKGELIVLKDAQRNPADRVHYYDGGRWPGYADGGGSSLELRDPWADNEVAEAWAASDESSRSDWVEIVYQGVASQVSIFPSQWNDFVFNFLNDGECLIDDLQVIQSPSSVPVQMIANGNFESGAAGWRFLGTHRESQVIPEPGNPGNRVLHLVATGPGEHMHNHIETTFTSGRTVVNGQTYEVRFRVKWLAGADLLNTRLYFNRVSQTTVIPRPERNGTPGAPNSRQRNNIGPTFRGLNHSPVIPLAQQSVTVSVMAEDPQGVAGCELFWSVNSGGWSHAPMVHRTNGLYTGAIPGYGESAVVQFYVQATDGQGAAADYPAAGPNSGALYSVQDNLASLDLSHNFRIVMAPANTSLMHASTNVMSNARLPGTVILDETRPYYDVGVRLKSSERGRDSAARVSFHVTFNPDDLFRGVHPVMLADRSGGGSRTFGYEILIKHMMLRAGGIPMQYTDLCRLIAPQRAQTGYALLFPRFEDEFIETQYDNGGDGKLFEYELVYYPTTTDANGYKLPQPDGVVGTDIASLGDDKEGYRYHFMIKNHRVVDDYSPMIGLAKTFSLSGAALDEQSKRTMDVDEWLRSFAMEALCGVGDTYMYGNYHNLLIYFRPEDGKALAFPWDKDFAFVQSATAGIIGSHNLQKIINLPGNLRLYYGHMVQMMDTVYNSAYMTPWAAHFTALTPGQSYSDIPPYIDSRANHARGVISGAGGLQAFNVSTASYLEVSNNLVTISGTAPVTLRTLKVNNTPYPVTWNSLSGWSMQVPVNHGLNQLIVQGFDLRDLPMGNAIANLTISNAAPDQDPLGVVVLNEIMYAPTAPGAEFVELFNSSTTHAFDLTGWRVNGLDYTFPAGTILSPNSYLTLAKNREAFVSVYGTSVPLFDDYRGNLQADGETLTLFRPGPDNSEIVVDRVRYDRDQPWPSGANGQGASLQVLDATRDNSRVINWSDGGGWRYISFTGSNTFVGANTNLLILPGGTGEIYLDDFKVVEGDNLDTGVNLLVNGGFEQPLDGTWLMGTNLTNSQISTEIKHSGNSSLRLVCTRPGTSLLTAMYQPLAVSNYTVYSVGFWYLPSATIESMQVRITSQVRINASVGQSGQGPSPGAANVVATPLPELPDVWLNEVQPENLAGPTDNYSEREPWIELFNSSPNPISLEGWHLTADYGNLEQWAFPAGTEIGPGEFLVIWADGKPQESEGTNLHTNFRIEAGQGSVALVMPLLNAAKVLDYLNYTNLAAGQSYGAFPDGQAAYRQPFFEATPGRTNNPAMTGISVVINEWMADNLGTLQDPADLRYDDWFELYNPATNAVDLSGYWLTDNLTNRFRFQIPEGYVVPARGYLLVWADNTPSQNHSNVADLHVNFALARLGDEIGLFAPNGIAIDTVTFGPQTNDISQGRYPNGSDTIVFMSQPTPRAANVSDLAPDNTPPMLGALPNQRLLLGQTLSFTALAEDGDIPVQTLTYSLPPDAPAGATLTPAGAFSWTPSVGQAPGNFTVTVIVTDSGSPPLSASNHFQVAVGLPPRVSPGNARLESGQFQFQVEAFDGFQYRVQYKDRLGDGSWTPLGSAQNPTGGLIEVNDPVTNTNRQRYYRVVVIEP